MNNCPNCNKIYKTRGLNIHLRSCNKVYDKLKNKQSEKEIKEANKIKIVVKVDV